MEKNVDINSNEKIKYYDLNSFCLLRKISYSKLTRLINFVPKENSKKYFRVINNKKYVTDAILTIKPNNGLEKTDPKKIMVMRSWIDLLGSYEWDFFGTVIINPKSKIKVVKATINSFYKKLLKKYKDNSFRLSYGVNSNFDFDDEFKFSFLIWVDDYNKVELKDFINRYFRGKEKYGNVKVNEFLNENGGEYWVVKEIYTDNDTIDLLLYDPTKE